MSKTNPDHPWHEQLLRSSAATRHSSETVARVVAAAATASRTEIAAAIGLSRNAVAGMIHRARLAGAIVVNKPGRAPVTVEPIERVPYVHTPAPKAKPAPRSRKPVAPTAVAPSVIHGTGVTILDVRVGQCRALDDRRECCCLPTVEGSSWCAGHRMLYVASVRRAA